MRWVTCSCCYGTGISGNTGTCLICNGSGKALQQTHADAPDSIWPSMNMEQAVRRALTENKTFLRDVESTSDADTVNVTMTRKIEAPARYARYVLNKMRAEGIKI